MSSLKGAGKENELYEYRKALSRCRLNETYLEPY